MGRVADVKTTGGRWQRSARLLVLASLITIVGFAVVCATIMLDIRRGQQGLAQQSAENLATAIEADLSRNLQTLDLSIRSVTINLLVPGLDSVTPEIRHLILFNHGTAARYFGALQVFDETGRLSIDASSFDPQPQSVADEEFFQVHRNDPNVGLFISRPMLYRGVYSIMLSRRVDNADGTFRGVVAGAIRYRLFHDLFDRLKLADGEIISLLRTDGVVLMRTPFDLDVVGKNLSHLPAVAKAMKHSEGSDSAPGSHDGQQRLFVWRSSPTQPIIILVGRPWESVFNVWRAQAVRISIIVGLLGLVATIVTLFLAREIQRRVRAEAALEKLASTDGLTGLRNRRKFDELIEAEWRRGARSDEPLTLLMIDVDHFKSYNDRFGHQAGDTTLRAVAACIAASARRPGDCAARYGGEEFALLLPGVGMMEALQTAEAIRERVMQSQSPSARFTVSIGVATVIPDGLDSPSSLLELADRALYDAKRGGRNQSRAAPQSGDRTGMLPHVRVA
jgi:diguanylate cyclase (GGDEF)-like protein